MTYLFISISACVRYGHWCLRAVTSWQPITDFISSIIPEGFGVVALEGIASGCVVLGADAGGLPEAIGPCGLTFERGSAGDLARKIEMVLGDAELRRTLQLTADKHLAKHQPSVVA